MWILTVDGPTFFKKDQMIHYLLNPPEPPFGLYFTRTYQKQGFFALINKVNYSRDIFFIGFDMLMILVDLEIAKEMHKNAKLLRKQGASKRELYSGKFNPKRFEIIDIELIEIVKQNYIKNPLWELIVYAVK